MSLPLPRCTLLVPLFGAFALVLTVLGVVVASGTAAAAPEADPDGVNIVDERSERCLGVVGETREQRTPVDIFDCIGQGNQEWTYTDAGELRVYGDRCLDVRGESTDEGAIAQIQRCNGQENQQWELRGNGSIVGVQSGLCLEVLDRRTANSSPVVMGSCNGQENQQWNTTLRDDGGGDGGSGGGEGDTEAPTTPANPRTSDLKCDSETSASVNLAWDEASDNVGVDVYELWHDGQFITEVDASTTSASIDLDPGTPWGLYVQARDAAGNVSQASNTVRVDPPNCSDDTEAPTTPGNLTASASGTSVSLSWDASSDDVGVRAYEVSRNGSVVGTVEDTGDDAPATSFRDTGLDADTTYTYTVTARDGQDNVSEPSEPAEVTTGDTCDSAVCGVEEVATDDDIPWGLVTLPNGSVLYTQRDAHGIIQLDPETGEQTSIGTVPNVKGTDGEGGLLGVTISSNFSSDRWLYMMYSSPDDNRVVRMKFEDGELQTDTSEVLVSGIERNKFHDGGRLRFGPDGKLYVATGDAQDDESAQDTSSLNGKILRINPDGSVPSSNPFDNEVWSYGHRNPQGIAFDSEGRLWQQEFGDSRQDETNLVVKGGNYGWPDCEGTIGDCEDPEFIEPKATYSNSEASCSGIAIVDDALYIACLRGTKMFRHEIDGDELTNREVYFDGRFSRLRTVEPTDDGGLWLTTSTEGDKDSIPNNSPGQKILKVTLGG